MKKILFTVFVPLVLLLSCVSTDSEQIRVEDNLMYKSGADYELFLDIAYPAGGGKHPALIFVMGAGWGAGNQHRSQFYEAIKLAAERGYVAVTIDHRKTGENRADGRKGFTYPAQLDDLQHAADWLVDNSLKYGIDTGRIGMVGWCSGGHLVMMHAFSDDEHPSVKAVVNIGGASDFLAAPKVFDGHIFVLKNFLGGTAEEIPERYAEASPVSHITPDDPPVYTIHGDANNRVPVEHAFILDEKLREAGVYHRMDIIPNGIHFKHPMDDEIWEFLDAYLMDS